MNRFRHLIAIALFCVALVPAVSADGGKKTPQVQLVRKLYKNFAWEAVLYPEPGETLAEQSKGALKDYFEGSLAELLANDAACAAKRDRCRLDVHPLFGMRDPVVHDLEVVSSDGAGEVLVRFSRADGGSARMTEIVVKMAGSGRGSRIADLVYPGGPSLRARLTSPLE
jgi:hypothetical protein